MSDNVVKLLQHYLNLFGAHHPTLNIPHLEEDGVRGAQTVFATRLAMFYLGFNGPNMYDARYNLVSDEQRIQWLQHPARVNPAMLAKGAYRRSHPLSPVIVLPNANRPGVGIHHWVLETAARMAAFAHETLYIQTGTNHCQYVNCDPSANQSDHWLGNAADFRVKQYGGPDGDLIAASALRVAGEPNYWREARRGDEHVLHRGGFRYDILWKTMIGGNHFDHVHVGVRPE